MTTEIIIVHDRFSRSPFQIFVMLLCILTGVKSAIGQNTSPSLETVPDFYNQFWGSMLLLGAVMALIGSFWRGSLSTGMLIERSGLYAIGGSAVVFGIIVAAYAGWVGIVTATTTAGFGAFCFSQVKYINKVINLYMLKLGSNGTPT